MMRIILLGFAILSLFDASIGGKRKPQGKVTYQMNWVGGFSDCENFNNEAMKATGLTIEKDSAFSTSLGGDLVLDAPLIDGTQIVIMVNKDTPQGKVLTYTMDITNVCDHVKEKGMPWSIFFDAMNLDPRECPIPAKTFTVNDIKLSMGFLDSSLNHETVGEYGARIEFQHQGDGLDITEHTLACYNIGFTVDEVREQSE